MKNEVMCLVFFDWARLSLSLSPLHIHSLSLLHCYGEQRNLTCMYRWLFMTSKERSLFTHAPKVPNQTKNVSDSGQTYSSERFFFPHVLWTAYYYYPLTSAHLVFPFPIIVNTQACKKYIYYFPHFALAHFEQCNTMGQLQQFENFSKD